MTFTTWQAKYVWRNIEARSRSYCCRGKALSTTYSECMSLPIVIQLAMCVLRMVSSVTCMALPHLSTLSHKGGDFRGGGGYWTWNMCFDFLYKFCLKIFSFWGELSEIWSEMSVGLHLKYPLFLSAFNETWVFLEIFEKCSRIKCHENRSSGSRIVACGQTGGRTDMTKLTRFSQFCERGKKNTLCFYWICEKCRIC